MHAAKTPKTVESGLVQPEGLISNLQIRGFLQGAVRLGHKPEAILAKADIPASVYHDHNACIDGIAFQRLLWIIGAELNDLFMGFLEQPAKPDLERVQANARFQCATFGEAIKVSTQFREAVRNDIHYDYRSDKKHHEFTLIVDYQLAEGMDVHLFYWFRLLQIYKYHCWLIGRRIKLTQVNFTSAPPEKLNQALFAPFNCKVLFNQTVNSLSFDQNYLHLPLARQVAEGEDFVKNYLNWFTIPGRDMSWSRQTEQVLVRLQAENIWSPNIAVVAEILSASARNLRRQLALENETYQEIKERVRCKAAIKLLLTSDLPLTLVAEQIGYVEPGNFTRAFIGWTQMSPSDYRKQYAADKRIFSVYS